MANNQQKPLKAVWLEPSCTVEDERSIGVTVARAVSLGRLKYEGAVTVEIFGDFSRHNHDVLDGDWPDTWSGDESATLTPKGARRLAQILNAAADVADAYRKERGIKD